MTYQQACDYLEPITDPSELAGLSLPELAAVLALLDSAYVRVRERLIARVAQLDGEIDRFVEHTPS